MKTFSTVSIAEIEPKFKLWFSSSEARGVFGDGKWRLLLAIDREGSLKAAAQSLCISYRKAWGDLKKAEKCIGVKLIEKHRGGTEGGTTRLTKEGKKWVEVYGQLRRRIESVVQEEFVKHFGEIIEE